MTGRLEPAQFDERAGVSTRAVLATLSEADLDRPATPEWDVRAVLSHLVGGNLRFAEALRGGRPDWTGRNDAVITTPLAEFEPSLAGMAEAIASSDDPKRTVVLEAGEPPAFFAVGIHATDMLLHGWDIAVATERAIALDPELCEAGLRVVGRYPDSFWGPGSFFASRIESGSDDPAERLLGLTGRRRRDQTGTRSDAV